MIEVGVVKDFYEDSGKIIVKKSYDFINGAFDVGNKLILMNDVNKVNVIIESNELIDNSEIILLENYDTLDKVMPLKNYKIMMSIDDYQQYDNSLLAILGMKSYD